MKTSSLFVTRGNTVTAVKDAAVHKDRFKGLLGTCVQHMVKPEHSGEAHRELATNSLHTAPTQTRACTHTHACAQIHTFLYIFPFYRGVEVSHHYIPGRIDVCMCVYACVIAMWRWGISGVPACESVWEHPESSQSWLQLIGWMKHNSWNCLSAIQRHQTHTTHTHMPFHIPMTPWILLG